MSDANRDQNHVPVALGQSSTSATTTLPFLISSVTGRLLVDSSSASGDVVGPASATDNAVALFDGTTGKLIKNSTIKLATTVFSPTISDGVALGSGTLMWSDLFLASGAVINFSNGDVVMTHTAGILTMGTGEMRITTVGTNTASVVTVGGTQNLTNKTLTSPTLVTPALGVATATSLAIGGATIGTNGLAVTGHLLLEGVTSTGATGTNLLVFATSPTLTTPVLGVATATSINGLTISTTTGTLTMTNGKTLAVTNTITLSGTDSTIMTFPTTSATIARTDAGQTFTGVNVFTSPKIITQISDTNGNILINIGATASAVNYVKITNAITGTAGPIISADGETNVDLKIAAKGTGKIHRTTGVYGDITAYSPTASGTATLTLNTSNTHTITMPAGNITIALSNEGVGQYFVIHIIQDSVGSRTVTWFTTIKWAGGVAPTLTTTANKIDSIGFFVSSAGNYYGYIVGQNL